MKIETRPLGPFQMNCYVIACPETGEGAIIDAGSGFSWIAQAVEGLGIRVTHLLQTHAHIDHVGGLSEAKARWPEAPIVLHRAEMPVYEAAPIMGQMFGMALDPLPEPDRFVEDGEVVEVGSLRFRVIFVPGHSPGSVAFVEEQQGVAFSGDCLFAGSIGRTDLPGGDYATLIRSLGKLCELPDTTRVLSGHGPETTVGREKKSNPFLLKEMS